GLLAIVAVGLMIGGARPERLESSVTGGFWESLTWYVVVLAVVAGVAGVSPLAPRTRLVVGPRPSVGAAGAPAWGIVFLVGERRAGHDPARWLMFAGQVVLVLAACLALLSVGRGGVVRVAVRRPRGILSWAAVAVGGLAALACVLALAAVLYQVGQL